MNAADLKISQYFLKDLVAFVCEPNETELSIETTTT